MPAMGSWVSVPLKSLGETLWNLSQNHHIGWCGSQSTMSLLMVCGPSGTLTPLQFQIILACGLMQVGQGKNGQDLRSIYSPVPVSPLPTWASQGVHVTHLPIHRTYQSARGTLTVNPLRGMLTAWTTDCYPSMMTQMCPTCGCCSVTLRAMRAQVRRHLLEKYFLDKISDIFLIKTHWLDT